MSQENVELVRALVEDWNSGARSFDRNAKYFDPAVELESPLSSVAGQPYRGHEGMDRWVRDIDEQFAVWRMEVGQIRDVGDWVLAIGSVSGRGRGSGVPVRSHLQSSFGSESTGELLG